MGASRIPRRTLLLVSIQIASLIPSSACFTFGTRAKSFLRKCKTFPATIQDDAKVVSAEDTASSTAELLASLWKIIVEAEDMGRGEQKSLLFPNMSEQLSDSTFVSRLMNYFDTCKDVCDDFGITTLLVPKFDSDRMVVGFTVKSYSDAGSANVEVADDGTGGYKFVNDPFWNDDTEFEIDPSLFEDDEDEITDGGLDSYDALPDDTGITDEKMIEITRDWVATMMSNMGVCPFTSGSDMAGLPMGPVHYAVDRANTAEKAYLAYWNELVRLEKSDQDNLSTTLLLLPEFSLRNAELFENLSTTLTQPLEPLKLEDLTQLVFFHPRWTFRDNGMNRAGGSAANYARRSPWPMINLLRTNQVRAAQKGIPTGLVYSQNEKTLSQVGVETLESMLIRRDWTELEGTKVNRREHDALSLAQDMQEVAGHDFEKVAQVVSERVLGEGYDRNAAINKVDKSQVEGGNLVNVICQALEKRLEHKKLSGGETSASMMASDFLLEELEKKLQ